ncbi:DUF2528 family protein [Pectobacterium brasiliense]|uniref:DUF2528 family protein n=1 Tax=Pectobacterium TaxID=122277 RepID=UPI003306B0AD
MDRKIYGINWFGTLDLIIAINHDIVTDELLNQINSFWLDGAERLEDEDGDVLAAVLKMLGRRCWTLMIQHGYDVNQLICHFNDGEEGWPKMNGSSGFQIIDCDELEFDTVDISVSEVVE